MCGIVARTGVFDDFRLSCKLDSSCCAADLLSYLTTNALFRWLPVRYLDKGIKYNGGECGTADWCDLAPNP